MTPWHWLLLLSIALFLQAARGLAADARQGYDVSMGGAGLYSGLWLMAAIAAAAAVPALLDIVAAWGVAVFAALYALKSTVYRIIVRRHLGADLPAPRDGFRDFLRKTDGRDDSSGGPRAGDSTTDQ